MHPRARHLVDCLGLQPHPEGGHYREVVRDEARVRHPTKDAWRSALTHIHFLLEAGAFSALHRVAQVEVWHHVEGGPLELTLVHEAEGAPPRVETVVLGREPGQRLLHAVPPMAWQAAPPAGGVHAVWLHGGAGLRIRGLRAAAAGGAAGPLPHAAPAGDGADLRMSAPRLLLVDDDRALAAVLALALGEEGFQVTLAHDGRAGLSLFLAQPFDVLVLDVLMPELDGLALCRRVRAVSAVPVVLLTSRAEELDRVTGLETGADDYVVKPFSTRELVARLKGLLRRAAGKVGPAATEVLRAGELEVDAGRFEVRWRGQPVTLTRSEFLVLQALAQRPGQVLGRDRLIDLARGDDVVITERTIDTFIKRIRQKLRAVDDAFDAVETVVGVGYRLRAP